MEKKTSLNFCDCCKKANVQKKINAIKRNLSFGTVGKKFRLSSCIQAAIAVKREEKFC